MGLALGLSTHNNTLQVLHRIIGAPHLIKTTLVSGVFSGWCSCCSILSFPCSVFYIIVCRFVYFILTIVFSVLLFMAYDYPFGILKLVLIVLMAHVNTLSAVQNAVLSSVCFTTVCQFLSTI